MNLKYILLGALAGTALLLGRAFSEDATPSDSQENGGLPTISIKQNSATPRKLKPETGRAIYSFETEEAEEPLATFSIKKSVSKTVLKNKPVLPKASTIAQSPTPKPSQKTLPVFTGTYHEQLSAWQSKLASASALSQTKRSSFATMKNKTNKNKVVQQSKKELASKTVARKSVASQKKIVSNGFENLFPEMSESDADSIVSRSQPEETKFAQKQNVKQVVSNPFRSKNHLIGYQPDKKNSSLFNSLFQHDENNLAIAEPPALLNKNKPTVKDATFSRRMKELQTPVNGIQLVSASQEVKEPKNHAQELQREMVPVHLTGIPWIAYQPNRYPVYFTHNPLYFEDLNLERCGKDWSVLEPTVSTGRFFANTLLLPYYIVRNCPSSLVKSPGDCPSCYKFPHKH